MTKTKCSLESIHSQEIPYLLLLLDPFSHAGFFEDNLRASIKTLLLRFCASFRRMKAHSPRIAQNDL